MAAPAIRTSRLTKDYGLGRGLFDLDLQVPPQEVFGYLGPNGAGKTTTIRLLMGMIRPTIGSAYIFGLDLGRRFREYSSGNKQKLAIVLAFMHKPDLLILDEPTSGLDPLNQQEFYTLLRQARDDGATVFLSSHVLSEVQRVCDRVGIIRDGRLITLSELDELRRIQLHRVEIDFGDESPVPEEAIRAAAEDVQVRGRHVTCTVSGSFDPLLNALRSSHVDDLVSTEPSLEEIFLSYFVESTP